MGTGRRRRSIKRNDFKIGEGERTNTLRFAGEAPVKFNMALTAVSPLQPRLPTCLERGRQPAARVSAEMPSFLFS